MCSNYSTSRSHNHYLTIYDVNDVIHILKSYKENMDSYETQLRLMEQFKKSKYLSIEEKSWTTDAKLYIQEKGLNQKVKNIDTLQIMKDNKPSAAFQNVLKLETNFLSADKEDYCPIYLFVLNEDKRQFQLQTSLLWSMMTGRHPIQLILSHGSVTSQENITLADYFRWKEAEMRQAAVHKYGSKARALESITKRIAVAEMKFELLSSSYTKPVKVKMSQFGDVRMSNDNHQGSFVLYNYARLTTLFAHFQDAVFNGFYPELPPIENIDFSLLREREEWLLLFNYLLPYPSLIKETIGKFSSSSTFDAATLQTHKICHFVSSLCHDLSSYYSRIHILVELRPHLIPLIHARLCLLQGVHQILFNCLILLDIQPLNEI